MHGEIFIRDQRLRYYSHRENARQEPHKCMSLIIDGMDQNKTSLPHLTRINKAAFNMWVMRTHVTGALAHGRQSYTFIDIHLWPHDANLTCTILLEILQHQQQSSVLPPVLYLQLDNCYRENKNQLFFGFVALLVHYKIFKEVAINICELTLYIQILLIQVQVGFLMVGHTHEDIDQYFSKLSQYLKYNSAHTLPGI